MTETPLESTWLWINKDQYSIVDQNKYQLMIQYIYSIKAQPVPVSRDMFEIFVTNGKFRRIFPTFTGWKF